MHSAHARVHAQKLQGAKLKEKSTFVFAPCKAPKIHTRHKKTNRTTTFGRLAWRPKRAREICKEKGGGSAAGPAAAPQGAQPAVSFLGALQGAQVKFFH